MGIQRTEEFLKYLSCCSSTRRKIIRRPKTVRKAAKIEINKCPDCGGVLKEKMGKFGRFVGCSNYSNCSYI